MKRINWERVQKIEYSARRAALKQPNSNIGKEMVFLLDTLSLLRLQNNSLRARIDEMIQAAPFLKDAIFNKKQPVHVATNVTYPITQEITAIPDCSNEAR